MWKTFLESSDWDLQILPCKAQRVNKPSCFVRLPYKCYKVFVTKIANAIQMVHLCEASGQEKEIPIQSLGFKIHLSKS